jgi:hypothetical protein
MVVYMRLTSVLFVKVLVEYGNLVSVKHSRQERISRLPLSLSVFAR